MEAQLRTEAHRRCAHDEPERVEEGRVERAPQARPDGQVHDAGIEGALREGGWLKTGNRRNPGCTDSDRLSRERS